MAFFRVPEALKAYDTELTRYGAIKLKNQELVKTALRVAADSQLTLFETHICRSLRKTSKKEQSEGVGKYLAKFSFVPADDVHPLLWEAAQATQST